MSVAPVENTKPNSKAVNRIAPIVHKLVPYAENITQLARLSLQAQAAFVTVFSESGTQLIGTSGLKKSKLPLSKPNAPEWLCPVLPRFIEHRQMLQEMQTYLVKSDLQNAFGVALVSPLGAIGALWVLNLSTPASPDNLHLLGALSKQLIQSFELESRLLDLELPHRIVQARDFAQSIIETVSVAVIVADAGGRIEYTNPAFERTFGFSLAETQNRDVIEFIVASFHELVHQARLARQRGESSTYRYQMYCQDGSVTDVEVTGHPRFVSGKYIGTVATVRDISLELRFQALELQEQALRASQHEREVTLAVVETAQEGFVISRGMTIEYANQKFAAMVGYESSALIGKKLTELVHPDDLHLSYDGSKKITAGENIQYQQRIFDVSGQVRLINYVGTPRRDANGKVIGVISSVRDITAGLGSEQLVEQIERSLYGVQPKMQTVV